jgi:hypothetical protein
MTNGPTPQAPGHLDPAKLDVLQVCSGQLAALAHDIVGELLALIEVTHSSALDRGDMDEYVLTAIRRLNESKALLRIEELHSTFSHIWPPLKTPVGVHGRTTIAQPSVRIERCLGEALAGK